METNGNFLKINSLWINKQSIDSISVQPGEYYEKVTGIQMKYSVILHLRTGVKTGESFTTEENALKRADQILEFISNGGVS